MHSMAIRQRTVGLAYHREGITDQLNIIKTQRSGQFDRADQGQLFGIAAGAKAQIVKYVLHAPDHHGSLADQRQERRHTLLLRTAKLIADRVEFLCIVRDVSASVIRIQRSHPMPKAEAYSLELPNGVRHAIELAWNEGEFAGFRFVHELDVAEFIQVSCHENARKFIRLQSQMQGVLRANGNEAPISFVNISQQGACLDCELPLAIDQLVVIDTGVLASVFAKIRWRRRSRYGLIFEQVFHFEQLAKSLAPEAVS